MISKISILQVPISNVAIERRMETEDLTSIAKLLIIQRSDFQLASLGFDLLSVSADLGNEDAALILVDTCTERKSTPEIGILRYQKALAHVKKLAIENRNLQAIVLLGKVHELAQQYKDAIGFYKMAMDAHERGDTIEDDRTALAEAFRNAGRLYCMKPGMGDTAIKCFDIAARVYGDALSFYFLAHAPDEHPQDHIGLLSQAAISGVTEATYDLGLWYASEGDDFTSRFRTNTAHAMACYWFELSKDLPKLTARAILHIARIESVQIRNRGSQTNFEGNQPAVDDDKLDQKSRDLPYESRFNLDLYNTAADLESAMTKSMD